MLQFFTQPIMALIATAFLGGALCIGGLLARESAYEDSFCASGLTMIVVIAAVIAVKTGMVMFPASSGLGQYIVATIAAAMAGLLGSFYPAAFGGVVVFLIHDFFSPPSFESAK